MSTARPARPGLLAIDRANTTPNNLSIGPSLCSKFDNRRGARIDLVAAAVNRAALFRTAAVALAPFWALSAAPVARAHETITVGNFTVEYGWVNEPPVAGQPNAVVINIGPGGASVQLYFSEAIEPHFSTISVVNTTGKRVNAGDARVDPADAAHLLLALPSLGDGVYLVVWSVISADDGHQSNTRKYGTERRRPAR